MKDIINKLISLTNSILNYIFNIAINLEQKAKKIRYQLMILKTLYKVFKSKQNLVFSRLMDLYINSVYKQNITKVVLKIKNTKNLSSENRFILNILKDKLFDTIDCTNFSIDTQIRILKIMATLNVNLSELVKLTFHKELKFYYCQEELSDFFSNRNKLKIKIENKLDLINKKNLTDLGYDNENYNLYEDYYVEKSNATIFDQSEVFIVDNHPLMSWWGFENSKFQISRLESIFISKGIDWICLRINDSKVKEIESAYSLISPMASDFGHFMWDILMRLKNYSNDLKLQKSYQSVVLSSDTPGNFLNFLNIMFPKFNFVKIENGEKLLVKRLCVPIPNTLICHDFLIGRDIKLGEHMYLDNFRWFSSQTKKFKSFKEIRKFERVYISRGKNPRWRRILNEERLKNLLKDRGFSIIDPDEYSTIELFSIFSNANEIIISAGSILFNLFFSNRNSKVIILMSTGFVNDVGNSVTPYYYFKDEIKEFKILICPSRDEKTYLTDFKVELKNLTKILN